MTKELTVVQQKAITVRDYINQRPIVDQIQSALPEFMNAKRFLRTIYTALLRNPALLDCTKESLLSAMIESAQLGLEPILGKAALIPYGGEVQFQPMYRGLIDLARRTAQLKITGHVVYANDEFDFEYGTNEKLFHKPFLFGDRGDIIGAYTVWTFEDGFQSFLFMPEADILKVREKSQAYKYAIANPKNRKAQECPWITWPDQQYIKTVIKRHSKLQPCSVEMERANDLDNRAEGRVSQADMIGKFAALPPVTEKTIEELVKEFDGTVNALSDSADHINLQNFLSKSAETFEKSIEEIKAEAIKDFDGFWKQFKAWESKQSPKVDTTSFPEGGGLDDAFRAEFSQLRSSFPTWFWKNKERIKAASPAIKKELEIKWNNSKACEGQHFPLGIVEPPVNTEGQGQMEENRARMNFLDAMRNYRSELKLVTYQKVLMVRSYQDMNDVPPGEQTEVLAAMSSELDTQNSS